MMPFFKIPTVLPGENGEADKDVETRIQPEEIAAYHDGYFWGTLIILKSGQVFMGKMTAEEFEQALMGYQRQIAEMARQIQMRQNLMQ